MLGVLAVDMQWQQPRVLRVGDEHRPEQDRERGPVVASRSSSLIRHLVCHRDGKPRDDLFVDALPQPGESSLA